MNGSTSKLLKKYSTLVENSHRQLKTWWQRDLNREERTKNRKIIKEQLRESDKDFFVPD